MKTQSIFKTFLMVVFTTTTFAQVGIGTTNPHPSAILELNASNKALLLTRVALTGTDDVTTIPTPTAGMIVYNTADTVGATAVKANNLYRFNGTNWDFFVDNDLLTGTVAGFNTSTLGYEPVKASEKATVTTAPGGATVTLIGCKTNPANGHVYCAYQLSTGTNFYNTFNLAKQIGGYLVTMTSNAERTWVNTNIVESGTGYNLGGTNIWIGYNKVDFAGNPTEFTWITGEKSKTNWETLVTEHNFNTGEPNNQNNEEGCVHIINKNNNTSRKWNDIPCGSGVGGWSAPWEYLIIEFNQ